ncbi:hypothetical protein, partial [Helicobacter pylori]|uniref:hypothetical protein n=1 Tax=Helicobacter pylori TaxID=210 RepID=UPI00197AF52E
LSFYHSIILSFYHSSNQVIKQRYHTFIAFTKTYLKIPYFLLFPLFIPPIINHFINPHRNLFKKFDSISPIFKSVGLTELNSIQGE